MLGGGCGSGGGSLPTPIKGPLKVQKYSNFLYMLSIFVSFIVVVAAAAMDKILWKK